MSSQLASAPAALPSLVLSALRSVWADLVRSILASAVGALSLLPLMAAVVAAGPAWLVALAALPPCLVLTGIARFAAASIAGERPRASDALRGIDPVLGVTLTGSAVVAGLLIGEGSALAVAGCVLVAVLAMIAPLALAYGAIRGRSGFAAWRGALILCAYRPSWALTVLAIACLVGFATAATAGVLVLLAPVVILAVACTIVEALLYDIDAASAAR